MNKKAILIVLTVIVFGLLATGSIIYLSPNSVEAYSYSIDKEKGFIHGTGYGVIAQQPGRSEKQRKIQAKRAARDNARSGILKAVAEENIETYFASVVVYGEGKISGVVKMPETVREEVQDGKFVVEIRIPVAQMSSN